MAITLVLVSNAVLDTIPVEADLPTPFDLDRALASLSWADRDIVQLWLDGESFAAIDRILRLRKGRAALRLKRSLASLRWFLEREAARRAAFQRKYRVAMRLR